MPNSLANLLISFPGHVEPGRLEWDYESSSFKFDANVTSYSQTFPKGSGLYGAQLLDRGKSVRVTFKRGKSKRNFKFFFEDREKALSFAGWCQGWIECVVCGHPKPQHDSSRTPVCDETGCGCSAFAVVEPK